MVLWIGGGHPHSHVSSPTIMFMNWLILLFVLVFVVENLVCIVPPLPPSDVDTDKRYLSDGKFVGVTLAERIGCTSDFQNKPPSRVYTSDRLAKLRELMRSKNISAYIILNGDDHQSEFVGKPDGRREFISGFSGSNGDAVVTLSSAALWTDSRYYLQADEQMDCNWLLMKTGDKDVPSMAEWIASELKPGTIVSVDSRKATLTEWKLWQGYLFRAQISMLAAVDNLIDAIWEGRPTYPVDPIFIHEDKFAGECWQSKVGRLRRTLAQLGADLLVLTALDEIAWLFNLRGADIPYTPVFRSYALVGLNSATLYLPSDKITPTIRTHLYSPEDSVLVMPYDWIWYELSEKSKKASKVLVPTQSGSSKGASFLINQLVPGDKSILAPSPIINMKAVKNNIEIEGTRNAHIRDSVALCQLWKDMEEGLAAGQVWDELRVVSYLSDLRSQQLYNRGPSFESIVAFGTNGALPHYIPSPITNKIIDYTGLVTIDSGGQYLDGTIDTTRVLSLGRPTARQVEVYTALLQGCINLVSTVFPAGQSLQQLDVIIRRPLYQLGLQYGHGSTHGTGVFLGVHESFNYTYDVNFVGSQEPGYYKDNDYGMRLENLVRVTEVPQNGSTSQRFFGFEPLTLVPYERKLIDAKKMDQHQIDWLKQYYSTIRILVGDEMINQGKHKLYKWLVEKTETSCIVIDKD